MLYEARSRIMRSIRSKDTSPELFVRSLVHRCGFRFRLHSSRLPGRPDLVLPRHRAVILVNGCFWHGHDCHIYNPSKKRPPEWERKIARNRERDRINMSACRDLGWKSLIVWECAIQGKTRLAKDEISRLVSTWLLESECDTEIKGT